MKFDPTGDSLFTLTDTAAHDRRKAKMVGRTAGEIIWSWRPASTRS